MKIILAGGTGLIGNELVKKLLESKHEVVLLSRKASKAVPGFQPPGNPLLTRELWDGKTLGPWAEKVSGADAVINLTGESIAEKRWTSSRKTKLFNSRINSTRIIVEAIAKSMRKPKVLINASAVGYYGSLEAGEVTESGPPGTGFLSELCQQWENEARKAEIPGVRIVLLRTGVVLDKNGGALKKMLLPFKLFAGGPIGSGRQWMPWIHLEDEIRIILFALEQQSVSGPINVTAPEPVSMKVFAKTLGKAMHRPCWAPVPGFVLKIVLGDMSSMVLTGQKAVPKKLLEQGYSFKYPSLDKALSAIFR